MTWICMNDMNLHEWHEFAWITWICMNDMNLHEWHETTLNDLKCMNWYEMPWRATNWHQRHEFTWHDMNVPRLTQFPRPCNESRRHSVGHPLVYVCLTLYGHFLLHNKLCPCSSATGDVSSATAVMLITKNDIKPCGWALVKNLYSHGIVQDIVHINVGLESGKRSETCPHILAIYGTSNIFWIDHL
jgi:hypothetical protein